MKSLWIGTLLFTLARGAANAAVVTKEVDESVIKSARNIPGVTTTFANVINPYDVLNAGMLVVDKAALETIEEVFA